MPFIKTENCSRYNKSESLMQTTFDCVECLPDFYLNGKNCTSRTIKAINCVEYSIDKDECKKCKP